MGCFLGCFGKSKERRRRRKQAKRVLPRDQRSGCDESRETTVVTPNQDCIVKPISPISPITPISPKELQPREDVLEEKASTSARKKVTFDLDVKTYENEEIIVSEVENEQDKEKGAITASVVSYPSNHRYQNCSHSDDEYEVESEGSDVDYYDDDDDEYGCSDDDDDDEEEEEEVEERNECIGEGESSESLFSLQTDSQKQDSPTPMAEKEVNSPVLPSVPLTPEPKSNQNIRHRSQYVHSVLNPVENLSQWKAVKAKSRPPVKPQKENFNFEQEPQIPFSSEPTFKPSPFNLNKDLDKNEPRKQEVAVDTSLSNWLGSNESTPSTKTTTSNTSFGIGSAEASKSQRSNSPTSLEDRPILGALTVEEIKQFSASSSPRRSPSHSPDEIPILGTVGRYWSHTGQAMDSRSGSSSYKGIPNTTSKYSEDRKVTWNSTPFQTRLERALNQSADESS